MRKILSGCFIAIAALMLTLSPALTSVAQDVDQGDLAPAPVKFCWGTFRYQQGIAVCDGAAYNCTHPCAPVVVANAANSGVLVGD